MADTQHTRVSGKAQADTTYADNTSAAIGAGDWRQEQRDIYESTAILASQNVFSEDNIFGEIDHVQVFGATAIDAYSNTGEVQPTMHVYCDDDYGIAIENTDNVDADTKRWLHGQSDTGEYKFGRISESGGTDTYNTVYTIDQNDIMTINSLVMGSGAELTIASGVITVTSSYHTVDTESDASTDDLNTINGGQIDGQLLILRSRDNARDTTVKHNTGNIRLDGGVDFVFITTRYVIGLMWTGTFWIELFRSNNS